MLGLEFGTVKHGIGGTWHVDDDVDVDVDVHVQCNNSYNVNLGCAL
jgi:hypothetical protein